ncbi:acyl-CoA hydrolase [Chryseobacterium rhizosphaerae]|uniref:AbiTii domain-containing protein n=1 Tax=Chryseobacterium rhizosphaerae TaxID=395937 RepID=UPI002860ED90|nr:hypothetical protein [Chryseobacterium rhizosphaerae]MDR6545062.1 acyl-CoA hydrolase [Chryseobacterium rhizosphaerae]
MELLEQIINELINTKDYSLNSALLKTKVLATRIQNRELLDWVNSELTGYNDVDTMPEYRKGIVNGLNGNYMNGRMMYKNHEIPTIGLSEDVENFLRYMDFSNSVTELENLCSIKGSTLNSPVRPEHVAIIEANWVNMGNPYLSIQGVNRVMSKSLIEGILSNVRNKLLDFMLKVDEEFGNITEIKELRNKQNEISRIVNNTIINNNGDGNVLNTGNSNSIENKPKIQKNSIENFEKQLREIKVPEQDISEIIQLVQEEEPNYNENKFGNRVNGWIAKMVTKTAEGGWDVAIGAAGSLLATAIQSYYGM